MRDIRLRRGIAQDRLGVLLGLDETTSSSRISRYETGTHAPPLPVAEKIAELLGVPLASLYCEDDELSAFIEDIASLDDGSRRSLRAWLDTQLAGSKREER